MISGDLMYDSDQLTLTCISTGGPATTVSWTRDNVNITGEQNETVLNDPETTRYTHTLSISTAGVYTCTVANKKPSSASARITVTGMYYIYAFPPLSSALCIANSRRWCVIIVHTKRLMLKLW